MKKFTKMHRGFVEQAGFVVLKNPDIPSLLIETGFITNPAEAKNLSNPKFRSRMAEGIFAGIDSHFRAKPPMDTALAAARGGKVTQTMDKLVSKPAADPLISDAVLVRRDSLADKQAADETDDLEKLVAGKTARKSSSSVKPAPAVKSAPAIKSVPVKKPAVKTVKHVVKKGDTLSSIASRYKVSMATLRDYNKLKDQQVRIGQTIQIPAPSN